MKACADFNKISQHEFMKNASEEAYERITLPKRATNGAAGYDFVTPIPVILAPGESVTIPTGIRVQMDEGVVLMLFPRSGLGFSHHMRLANTTGIIDSDYYHAQNEGHIMVRIINGDERPLALEPGERFCQGVFLPFYITYNDKTDATRQGGIGSTGL